MKILFLSANPRKTGRLRLDKEFWEIRGSIVVSKARNEVFIQFRTAVKSSKVQEFITKEKPDIVHFSGHGNFQGDIILEDEKRNPHPISPQEFAAMFKIVDNQIKCVVLSCCYSAIAAKEISRFVDCVIGIKTDLEDESAIAFASAFYLALGENKDLQISFDFAISEFLLKGGLIEEKPELFVQPEINPSKTYFITKNY